MFLCHFGGDFVPFFGKELETVAKDKINDNRVFVQDKHIWKRFFKMLIKAKLPYVWIAIYIILTVATTNLMLDVTEYTSEMFAGNLNFAGIILPWLIYTALNLVIAGVGTMLDYLCMARVDRNLRRMVWDKITRLPLGYFNSNQPKELLTRITSDTSVISSLLVRVVIPFFTGLYTLYATFRRVGTYDASLMWSLLIVVPFVLVIAFITGKLNFGVNDKVNRANAEMAQDVSEKVSNLPLVKSFANEQREIDNGEKHMKNVYRSNIRFAWITQLTSPIFVIVGALQLILVILLGRSFYSKGAIDLAQWIAYLAFAQQIANTLQGYAGYWDSFKAAQGATRRVTYIMDEKNEDLGPEKSAEDMDGDIVFDGVGFAYEGKTVFDNLSLTIPKGKITAVIGPSGSGKTTLLNPLERFYTPKSGVIRIGGENIDSFHLHSYRDAVAYVTQENALLGGSIRDNILYGIKREVSEEELVEACRSANAYSFIQELPKGFDTDVGESGDALSGGQKQRIAIARALLKAPSILLLDEATAAMDAGAKEEIWQGLRNLMAGKTTLMVAHDYQSVKNADYVIVLENGKVSDSGTREELAMRNTFYRQLAGLEEEAL